MTVSVRFARHQLPVIAGMGSLLLSRGRRAGTEQRVRETRVAARPDALLDAYVAHVGGDPARYATTVPPHFFPQWAFAEMGTLLRGLPYPLHRAMNGGCRLEARAPLPRGRDLHLRSELLDVDDDGRRAVITARFVTGAGASDEALVADVRVFVPLARAEKSAKAERERPRAPGDAKGVGAFSADRRAGLEFALLTGDFNPVHWVRPLARASGFRDVILHGFGTLARTWEILARHEPDLSALDVRFTRPLVLPATARVEIDDVGGVWVSPPEGGDAFLAGTWERT